MLTHRSDSVLHQIASEVISAAVNPVRVTTNVSLFPLTVSWGREPSTWVRLWYICSAVPSRNRPHPPINNVSPEKQNQGQAEAVVSLRHPTQQEQRTMCWSMRTHISSHSEWRYYVYKWCHVTWQWVCCTGMSCMKDCTLLLVHQLFMFTDKDLWTQQGRQCTHPPTQSSTCDQRYGREWTGTSHWWSYTAKWREHTIKRRRKNRCTYHWHVVILTGSGHLEFLAVGDFIRQTPYAIVSPVHLQPGNLLQQGLVPPSVVPDQRRQVSSGVNVLELWYYWFESQLPDSLTSDGVWWGWPSETSPLSSLFLAAVKKIK